MSYRQKIRHDVKKYVIHQKYISASCCQNLRHNVKQYVMISKVHHDVKKYVITSKLCHKIKSHGKYVNISKRMSYKSQNVRHVVKNYVMTSKSTLWCQKVLHNIMTSTSTSWHQNVCFNVEKYIKRLPWMVKEKIKKVRLDIKRLCHIAQKYYIGRI